MKGERRHELRLALSLGFRSIREMKQGMKAREWEELKALGRMERLGDERRDYVVAAAGFVTARAMGSKVEFEDLLAVKDEGEATPETLADRMDRASHGSQHSNPSN